MAIKKLHLVYFSPSGTTEKTVRTIASGIDGLPVETHNLLPYESRRNTYKFGPEDCVIMGTMDKPENSSHFLTSFSRALRLRVHRSSGRRLMATSTTEYP